MEWECYSAIRIASLSHGTQVGKFTNIPYIYHCISVMELVDCHYTELYLKRDITKNEKVNALCAAVLHDTIEDTDITYSTINNYFNKDVADYVSDLTNTEKKLPHFRNLNRKERKELDLIRIKKSNQAVQIIKACDLYDNIFDIKLYDKDFYPIFKIEVLNLLENMHLIPSQLRMKILETLDV